MTPHWLTLVSALLIVSAFPPWGFSILIWICLVPWLFALKRSTHWRHAMAQGAWLSFLMGLMGFFWVAWVLHEFGQIPWAVAILGFLVFSVFGQPQFILLAPLIAFCERTLSTKKAGSALALTLLLALTYAGTDWILPKIFKDTLGHALFNAEALRQLADLGGAHLLTALVVLVNLAIFSWIQYWVQPTLTRNPVYRTGLALSALLALLAAQSYGKHRLVEIREKIKNPSFLIRATGIQANIGDFDKVAAEQGLRGASERVLSTYFSLSDHALELEQKPDFLVWPETAYPSTFRTPNSASELERDQKLEDFVRSRKIPLLFGGYDHFLSKDYNALFLLAPEGERTVTGIDDLQIYRKNILLLFGEYIPFAEDIKFIRDTFPQVGNFGRGKGPELLTIPIPRLQKEIKTGPIICYEALFPNYVIEAARKGSQLILNITNDSWFGPYGEPPLHLALVAFRSIETRLPQLRATNTGISALILPDGEFSRQTLISQPEILSAEIPITDPIPTLIKKWGDWFGPFALLLGLFGFLGFLLPPCLGSKDCRRLKMIREKRTC